MVRAILMILGLSVFAMGCNAKKTASDESITFEMREVSLLDAKEEDSFLYETNGIAAVCRDKPNPTLKKHPEWKARNPLYGTLDVDGARYAFVVDGPASPGKDQSQSLASMPNVMYFDANGDQDLTNDPPLSLMKEPPRLFSSKRIHGKVFECVSLPVDFGTGIGKRTVSFMPVLVTAADGTLLYFVPSVCRQGTLRFGKTEFLAVLSQSGHFGRFDRPTTWLRLKPVKVGENESLANTAQYLRALRRIEGELYDISTTPLGDKLIVKPYRGEFGLLQVTAAGRETAKPGVTGMLLLENDRLVPLVEGRAGPGGETLLPPEHKLPVGDYRIQYLNGRCGRLAFTLRQAYSPNSTPEERQHLWASYPIKIRQDKPFLLDFANKPEFEFADPPEGKHYKPGETVRVAAFLSDPNLGLMVSDLAETEVGGNPVARPDKSNLGTALPRKSLDPTVEITDSSGKKVAEGKMPFG